MRVKLRRIYLASQSPRRLKILNQMRIPVRVVPAPYRERKISGMRAESLVLWRAWSKAQRARIPRSWTGWVLAADTEVVRGNRIFGKPKSYREARRMLASLGGRAHWVYTGVVLLHPKTQSAFIGFERTQVRLKPLSALEIKNYIRTVNPLDKAGAYGIQEPPRIVSGIKGHPSNVAGLPRRLVLRMIRAVQD